MNGTVSVPKMRYGFNEYCVLMRNCFSSKRVIAVSQPYPIYYGLFRLFLMNLVSFCCLSCRYCLIISILANFISIYFQTRVCRLPLLNTKFGYNLNTLLHIYNVFDMSITWPSM